MNDIFDYEHPFVCTDAVVFTFKTRQAESYRKLPALELNVLLYQREEEPFNGQWCLPGGFLNIDELPEHNVRRKIQQKVQIDQCYLEQLYTFCDPQRDPRARVISISYLGLLTEDDSANTGVGKQWFTLQPQPDGSLRLACGEITLQESDLAFDHCQIIQAALERLRAKILYSPIIFYLMPETFTLTQLQNAYETILGRKEQAANFRRKIGDLVKETDQYIADKGHRPAQLFTKR